MLLGRLSSRAMHAGRLHNFCTARNDKAREVQAKSLILLVPEVGLEPTRF